MGARSTISLLGGSPTRGGAALCGRAVQVGLDTELLGCAAVTAGASGAHSLAHNATLFVSRYERQSDY